MDRGVGRGHARDVAGGIPKRALMRALLRDLQHSALATRPLWGNLARVGRCMEGGAESL